MQEIGRSVIRLESVDSTNNYVANRARKNELRHGAVILAVEQTAGKGQLGAAWDSQAGSNLTFSVFLDNVNLSVERQFLLTKIVSLCLLDVLENYGLKARIKWPNDIYVENRKIAGILIENTIQGKTITRSIIGVGLNVNQKDFGSINATSLSLEKEKYFSNDEVLFSLISSLNKRLEKWEYPDFDQEYIQNLYRLEEKHQFEDESGIFEGGIVGVTSAGELKINRGGEIRQYRLKSIRFIP